MSCERASKPRSPLRDTSVLPVLVDHLQQRVSVKMFSASPCLPNRERRHWFWLRQMLPVMFFFSQGSVQRRLCSVQTVQTPEKCFDPADHVAEMSTRVMCNYGFIT